MFENMSDSVIYDFVAKYDYMIEREELNVALEDLENVESEKESLKRNLKEENDRIKNLREKIKKCKEIYGEFNDKLKKESEDITSLMVKVE
jgi:chromosome segregation ATPase